MGQSSSTPLSVMTDHEDWESQKKKLILEESSLYPSLIDLDTEISPPPICAATLAPAGTSGVVRRTKGELRTLAPQQEGGQPGELVEGPEGAETRLTTGAKRPLRLLFERFLSGSGGKS